MDKLSEIKERFNEDEIERDDVEWLIEQAEKAGAGKENEG